ncbi:MAG: hypothetical protein JWP01_3622 [Myxococcales bacterium]|nr:hypothetical protein [Myxococcales bacterium]
MIDLAHELPYRPPPSHVVEEMRTTVLAMMDVAASPAPRRGSRRLVGAAAAAAMLAILVVSRDTSTPTLPRADARVTSVGAATFKSLSPAPDEVIRLIDGLLTLTVSPLGTTERCRVVVGDGEVEVRGTAVAVEARADHLVRVSVSHGRVEVRVQGRTVLLGAGEVWEAPVRVAERLPVVVPVMPPIAPAIPSDLPARRTVPVTRDRPRAPSRPELATSSSTPSPARAPDPAGRAFRDGWTALQGGDHQTAAESFDRALQLSPTGGVAEDAAFWRATAYVRAKRPDAARRALTSFLTDYRHTVRAGEAMVMLGWLLIDANELASAETQFKSAMTASIPSVRTSAEAGLADIAHRRSNGSRTIGARPSTSSPTRI